MLEQRAIKLEDFVVGETGTQLKNILGTYGDDLLGLAKAMGQSVITEIVKILTPMSTFYNRFTKQSPGDILVQEINSLNKSIDGLKQRGGSGGAQQGSQGLFGSASPSNFSNLF